MTREYLKSIKILERVKREVMKLEEEAKELGKVIQDYEKEIVELEAEEERLAQEAWSKYVSVSEAILREVEVYSRRREIEAEILEAEKRRADAEESMERLRMDELEKEEEIVERLKEEVDSMRTEYEEVRVKRVEMETMLTEVKKHLERLEDSKKKLMELSLIHI